MSISKFVFRFTSAIFVLILALTILAQIVGHGRAVDEVVVFVQGSPNEAGLSAYVWDGQVITKIGDQVIGYSALFASDDSLAWAGAVDINHFNIYVWNGHERQTIAEGNSIMDNFLLAQSSDGQLVWLGGFANEINRWDGQNVQIISNDEPQKDSLIWSSNGSLAWRNASGQIFVWTEGQILTLENAVAVGNTLTWSEDGRLAWVSLSDVFVWDGNQVTNITEQRDGIWSDVPKWSPNGALAWLSTQPDGAMALNAWSGQIGATPMALADDFDTIGNPSWSADGRLVWSVQSGRDSEIYIWDGPEIMNVSQSDATDKLPIWSPDGRLAWVSYRDSNAEIYVWDGSNTQNVSQSPAEDSFPSWSEGGHLSWVTRYDNSVEISTWDGREIKKLSIEGELLGDLHWLEWH